MSYWCIIVAVLGIAKALPATAPMDAETLMKVFASRELGRNNAIETIIINALEDLRETMVSGSGTVPVLDPFELDRLYIDDATVPIPGARLELQNLVVSHLSTFNLKRVSVTSQSIILQRYNALIDIDFPELDVKAGFYDLFIGISGLSLYGSGDAHIVLANPEVGLDALIGIRLGASITLNIINLRVTAAFKGISSVAGTLWREMAHKKQEGSLTKSYELRGTLDQRMLMRPRIINLSGIFHETTLDSFINSFLENLIMQIQEYYAEDIFDFISPIIQDVANDILSDINIIDLLPV